MKEVFRNAILAMRRSVVGLIANFTFNAPVDLANFVVIDGKTFRPLELTL